MKNIKKDNSGFTLVELLIAIVIIAIVMIPMYSNFRESTYLNGRAKAAMDATNMASNIMEGLSAYAPDEIILGFYSVDDRHVSNNALPELNILPNEVQLSGGYGDLKNVSITTDADGNVTASQAEINLNTKTMTSGGSGYSYANALFAETLNGAAAPERSAEYLKVKKSANDKYYFYIEGAKQARGTYDVIIEMDASADSGYSGDLNGDGVIDTSASESERYNDYEAAEITSMNPLFDGVYTDSSNGRDEAAAHFVSKFNIQWAHIVAEDLYPYLIRTLTITIERDINNFAVIRATETYSINKAAGGVQMPVSGCWVDLNTCFDGPNSYVPSSGVTIFDGSVYKQEPRDIYIYYIPNYKSTTTSVLDNFEINNVDDIPVNVHMVRLKTNETTEALESTYRSSLKITDDATDGYQTQIYSNLRDNILKNNADNQTNRNDFTRCRVTINGVAVMSATTAYQEMVHENGGVKTEVKDRLYSVRIFVYKEGAAADGFKRDDLITTFDGSSSQ
ncbi:MAG: prepilin-type N-terminal cleavage/methylation domain-containing protein [Lachnospiraceae bacterium]|nr:prepilin-type N-terminal cleavage/methylation domain-containing protein [Lachnospiraceae bacterium]